MEKLSYGQLIDEVRQALDVSATPYFSDEQIASALNQAYSDWLTEVADRAETDERIRRELGGLVSPTVTANLADGKLDLNGLASRPYRLLSIMPVYAGCNGVRPARPLSFDAWKTAELDPWNAPTQTEPAYLDGNGFVSILPVAQTAQLVYIVRPRPISAQALNEKTEVEYEVQIRLIQRAAAMLAIPQENAGAYQALTAEYTKNEVINQ